MTTYIAFLRGINVGNIRIKMSDLKSAFEQLGYTNVKTYLQTGNVVFSATQSINEIKIILEKHLSEVFHYQAFVLLYEVNTLSKIISIYPFQPKENFHDYVIFIKNKAIFEELIQLSSGLGEESQLIAAGNMELYWQVPKGSSTDTPFAKIVSKAKYKSSITIRNINTLEKILEG